MNCPAGHCDKGFTNCCKECAAYEVELCKEACPGAEVYDEPGKECIWAEEPEKMTERHMMRWVAILLIAVLVMLAFALWQTARNVTYIDKIKSGQSVAAEQSAVPKKDTITIYIISALNVKSNNLTFIEGSSIKKLP